MSWRVPILLATALLPIPPTMACDLCAIYAAGQARGELGKGYFAGANEQFTHYGTLQFEDNRVPNSADQFLDSSITQILFGYNFSDRLGVQANLPYIYRDFRRPEAGGIHHGNEQGLGDASLLLNYEAYRYEKRHATFACTVFGGLKLPTGSTSRLREETFEMEEAQAIPSGIHGHDLTLGTGSYDGLVGSSLYGRYHRAFLAGSIQYAIRSEGDFDYRFANDLLWSAAPGFLLLLKDDYTLSLEANVSGEYKPRDEFRGAPAEDTGMTAVYMGPQLVFTWQTKVSAQLGLDIPVMLHNTALQIVPDHRVRAGLVWRF